MNLIESPKNENLEGFGKRIYLTKLPFDVENPVLTTKAHTFIPCTFLV